VRHQFKTWDCQHSGGAITRGNGQRTMGKDAEYVGWIVQLAGGHEITAGQGQEICIGYGCLQQFA